MSVKEGYLTAHGRVVVPAQTLDSPDELDRLLRQLAGLRKGMSWPHPDDEPQQQGETR